MHMVAPQEVLSGISEYNLYILPQVRNEVRCLSSIRGLVGLLSKKPATVCSLLMFTLT